MTHELDNSFKIYLREASQTPLLTLEEEGRLAERILAGDAGARDHMIRANLRLVIKIAQDYANYGVPVTDLISEGNIGLMKAVDKFDPKKGGKVSTYAAWWIKQAIKQALTNQSKTIRLPVHMVDKIARLRRIEVQLTEEFGREPTDEEVSDVTGIPEKSIRKLKSASQSTTSLDAPINTGEATTHGELLADLSADDPLEMLTDKSMRGELSGLLSLLDERERAIIESRFGLNGNKEMTLEEVGREFGVTRERIRQLQNMALKKMGKKLKKVEKVPSVQLNGNELIAQAGSIIAILRAESQQKELQVLMSKTNMKDETKELILRRALVGKTGKNWYECLVAALHLLRKAQGDMSWKKIDVRWSDIETLIISSIIMPDDANT